MTRTLVAGFGSELRGDDGFGLAVVRRLRDAGPLPGLDVLEVGTAGIRLAQELLTPCDRLIVVDAMRRGGAPGSVYVVRVEAVEPAESVDPHEAVPARALAVAKALGALPAEVFIVGCEPGEVDELTTALTPPVAAAVATALARVAELAGVPAPGPDPLDALRCRDEVLQIMFWLFGEGLGPDVARDDVLRFAGDAAAVDAALAQLVDEGLAEPVPGAAGGARYRLTAPGVREGRRRFLDEFEPYLARHAHGECGSADCDCHRDGPAACRAGP